MQLPLITFIEHWLGGLAEVFISFSGVFLCVLVISAFWDRRAQVVEFVVVFLCGLFIAFHQLFVGLISDVFTISRSVAGIVSAITICVLFVLLYLRRRQTSVDIPYEFEEKSSIFSDVTIGRSIRGTKIGAPLVILHWCDCCPNCRCSCSSGDDWG